MGEHKEEWLFSDNPLKRALAVFGYNLLGAALFWGTIIIIMIVISIIIQGVNGT